MRLFVSLRKIFTLFVVCIFFGDATAQECPELQTNDRMTYSEKVSIQSVPYIGSFRIDDHHVCGGAFINMDEKGNFTEVKNPQFFLTAAHCLSTGHAGNRKSFCEADLGQRKQLSVFSGHRFNNVGYIDDECAKPNNFYDLQEVEQVWCHDQKDNDIALLKLSRSDNIPKDRDSLNIRLRRSIVIQDPKDYAYLVKPYTRVRVSGWGYYDGVSSIDNNLRSTVMPIVDREVCKKLNDRLSTDLPIANFCASWLSGSSPESCKGDSGGPAVVEKFRTNFSDQKLLKNTSLIGLVSKQPNDAKCTDANSPNQYVDVMANRLWISKIIAGTFISRADPNAN